MISFEYEKKLIGNVVGVDEVGRGCLAGPVVVACVFIKKEVPKSLLAIINDSKQLSIKNREYIYNNIKEYILYETSTIDVETIDKINILQATMLAMENAVLQLSEKIKIDHILVDGNRGLNIKIPTYPIIKGDTKSYTIAIASIMAKVFRDNLMADLAKDFKAYGWEKNAGYGTKYHLNAMANVGLSIYHRKSFAPCKKYS